MSIYIEYFEDYKDKYEEKAFWIFVHLLHEKNWRSIFKDGTPKLFEMMKYFEKELDLQAPEIFDRIDETNVSSYFFFLAIKGNSLAVC